MHALHDNHSHRPTSFFIEDILLNKPKSAVLAGGGSPGRSSSESAASIASAAGSLFTRPGVSSTAAASEMSSAAHVAAIAAASLQPRMSLGPPVRAHLPAEYAASLAAYLPGPAAAYLHAQQHPFAAVANHPAFGGPKPDHPFLLPAAGNI